MIRIYNTLKREKEDFVPMEEGKVRMYVCGPTVYDVPHIGHARSAYVFDVIRNYLEHIGLDVRFVRNVTDIDDKIINKAVQELDELGENITSMRLEQRVRDVAVKYLDIYHRELDMLGIGSPDEEPKATENIGHMLDFIQVLIDKGVAYESDGDVYFSVEKFPEYGKLSNRDIEQMMQGVRKEVHEGKKHPLDFALWKKAKENEPFWESPWGRGRPGWHIECSVMSTRMFGAQFDIHGGGLDLIFPHHENEIAQAEAATGRPFANCWIHNGLLTVNGEKMSKSLGNYITIEDYIKEYKDPDLIKLAFLTSHYRSPMDFSDERMQEARRAKERIMIFFGKADRIAAESASGGGDLSGGEEAETLALAQSEINSLQERFEDAMKDDFNTAQALSAVFDAIKAGNDHLADDALNLKQKAMVAVAIKNSIVRFTSIFGLSLKPEKVDASESEAIEKLVEDRQEARRKKDYREADRIRKELEQKGIVVEDTPEGPVWRKK